MNRIQGTVQRGSRMAAEIAEQPQVWQRQLEERHDRLVTMHGQLLAQRPRFVLIAARGTSDHAALYAKYLVETRLGLPAGLVSASAVTLYHAAMDMRDVLFLAVSQSGQSPDLVETLRAAAAGGATTVAVTNDPSSPLAQAARHHADIGAGVESAVAATKTYTASLLTLFLMLTGQEPVGLVEAAESTLELSTVASAEAADRYRSVDRLLVVARGFSYPTAREAALKLMETSYISAQAFSAADLMHGPFAMVGPELPVIAVSTPGAAGQAMAPVLERLRSAGAEVLVVGDQHGLPVDTTHLVEELTPLVEILPLQLLALNLALVRGQDPDRPRGLSKITETR